jgi:hypothetical protein
MAEGGSVTGCMDAAAEEAAGDDGMMGMVKGNAV